jgi:hypothetical protein
VYILIVEAIERRKTGVEYAEVNGITLSIAVRKLSVAIRAAGR